MGYCWRGRVWIIRDGLSGKNITMPSAVMFFILYYVGRSLKINGSLYWDTYNPPSNNDRYDGSFASNTISNSVTHQTSSEAWLVSRNVPGAWPTMRLNARLNAASDP